MGVTGCRHADADDCRLYRAGSRRWCSERRAKLL